MPWTLTFAIGWLVVFVIGAVIIAWGVLVPRVGSDRPVRVGLTYRWGWTEWERPLLYSERRD